MRSGANLYCKAKTISLSTFIENRTKHKVVWTLKSTESITAKNLAATIHDWENEPYFKSHLNMYLKVYWNSRFLKHFQCFLCFSLLELNATHPPKNKGKLIIWIARNKNSGKKSCLPTCLHTHIHMVLYYVRCHMVYLFGQMLEFFYKKTLFMPMLRNRIVFLSLWCHASRGFRGLCLGDNQCDRAAVSWYSFCFLNLEADLFSIMLL